MCIDTATLTQIPGRQLQIRRVRDVHCTVTSRQLLVLPNTCRHPKRDEKLTRDAQMDSLRRAAHDVHAPDLHQVVQSLQAVEPARDVELDRIERDLPDAHVRNRPRVPLELERQLRAVRQVPVCDASTRGSRSVTCTSKRAEKETRTH